VIRGGRLLLLLLGAPWAAARAQVVVETEPAPPVRGTLIRLRVTPTSVDPVTAVEGEIAAEPLHFESGDGVTWSSLAGIPIEGGDSLAIRLVLVHGETSDTVPTAIAVNRGDYPSERLRVSPRMAAPDSAARVRIARDNARARAVTRAAHDTPRLWDGPFAPPRPSRITSFFGTARIFNGRIASRHMGTDFNGDIGDPVTAPSRGRVALVANFYLAGKVIYLDHGEGLVSAYFHLSRALVRTGDEVHRGQVIGVVGRSGRVTGPHLHWVTRYGGTSVDPMSVVALLGGEGNGDREAGIGGH
jgi:murein DD-endopeptidase MepM/ murein hydrolase activator NlpD